MPFAGWINTPPTPQIRQTLVSLLTILGWYYIRLGRLAEAEAVADRAQVLYQQLNIPPTSKYVSDPRLISSIVALIQGDYETAAAIAETVRQASDASPHPSNLQTAAYLLARVALLQGQFDDAAQHIQQAYTTVQHTGDDWFRAYCLIEMGNIALAQKNHAAAQEYYQAAYALRQKFNDPEGMAVALNHLGDVALQKKSFAESHQLFEQGATIYRDIGDKGGLATALCGLGRSAVGLGNASEARLPFQEALQIAKRMQFTPLLLSIFAGIADLLQQTGLAELRLALLTLIAHHSTSPPDLRERASQKLPPAADIPPSGVDMAALLLQVQRFLSAPLPNTQPEPPAPAGQPSPLVEPLTEREIEVLQLMTAGLTNPEIAERLIIATGTVKYYTGQIYGKLGVRNRVEAVAKGRTLNCCNRTIPAKHFSKPSNKP